VWAGRFSSGVAGGRAGDGARLADGDDGIHDGSCHRGTFYGRGHNSIHDGRRHRGSHAVSHGNTGRDGHGNAGCDGHGTGFAVGVDRRNRAAIKLALSAAGRNVGSGRRQRTGVARELLLVRRQSVHLLRLARFYGDAGSAPGAGRFG